MDLCPALAHRNAVADLQHKAAQYYHMLASAAQDCMAAFLAVSPMRRVAWTA